MSAFLFLPLVRPLIGAGVLALGLFAMAACWLPFLAVCVGLVAVQAAAWAGLGFALLLLTLLLPSVVLWGLTSLAYGAACWLLVELILSRPWQKTGWSGGGANEL